MTGRAGYRLLTNFSSMALSDIATKVISLLTVAYYSRLLGPAGLAELSLGSTLVGYLILVCFWGYSFYGLEEIGRFPERTNDVVSSLQSFRAVLAILLFAALCLTALVLPYTVRVRVLLVGFGLTILSSAYLAEWPFQALEKMRDVATAKILAGGIAASLMLIGIGLLRSSPWAVLVIPVATAVSQVAAAWYLWGRFGREGFRFQFVVRWREWVRLYRTYWMNGLSTLVVNLYLSVDIVLLGWWASKDDTGLYSAGYRLTAHLISFALIFNGLAYPLMARYAQQRTERLGQLVAYFSRVLITLYAPLCLIGLALAEPVLRLIFGPWFAGAGRSFEVLLLATIFTTANLFYGQICLVLEKRVTMVGVLLFQLVLNVALNALWIPEMGRQGAAYARLASEIAGMALYLTIIHTHRGISFSTITKPVPAIVILGGCLYLLRSLYVSAWIVLPVASLVFALALIVTRGATLEDLRFLKQLLSKDPSPALPVTGEKPLGTGSV